jgi:hypothetical protein
VPANIPTLDSINIFLGETDIFQNIPHFKNFLFCSCNHETNMGKISAENRG